MDNARQATTLYQLYDESDALLYVGISGKWITRLGQHAAKKGWWDDVAAVKRQAFPSREEALAAEATAIRTEQPRHNVLGLPREKPPRAVRELPVFPPVDQEILDAVVADTMALLRAAYDELAVTVAAIEDPVKAFELLDLLDRELQSIIHENMTLAKAHAAAELQEKHGLSLAELAQHLGRSKSGVALLLRKARENPAA